MQKYTKYSIIILMKEGEKMKKYIHIALDSDLKEDLIKEAKKKGLSLNSYIRMVLIENLKK